MSAQQVREKLKLSRKQMMRACGVGRSTWEKWEHGRRQPSASTRQLFDALLFMRQIGVLEAWLANRPE